MNGTLKGLKRQHVLYVVSIAVDKEEHVDAHLLKRAINLLSCDVITEAAFANCEEIDQAAGHFAVLCVRGRKGQASPLAFNGYSEADVANPEFSRLHIAWTA